MTDVSREAGPASGPASSALPDDVSLWLVRHGETEWSASGRHTSRTEQELTPAGAEQARRVADVLGGMLGGVRPHLVLCSPRRRAQQTAALAGLDVAADHYAVDEDLTEWDYGRYEGRTSAQIRAERPGWTLFADGVPGGETAAHIGARADRVLDRARAALTTGPVILVGHGHINRVLGARWLRLPVTAGGNLLLGTAAPCLLSTQYGEPVLAHWNLPNPATPEGT